MAAALAYIRYSSDPQGAGDSRRRQRDLAEATARHRGLTITEWIEDLGVSAYRGQHVETGNLGRLLDRISGGKVERGTYLLFESFDRLSRLHVFDSTRVILDLYEAGIVLITTADNTVHEHAQGLLGLLRPMFEAERAHGESARKAGLGRDTWTEKRNNAAKGGAKMTSICPAWLRPIKATQGHITGFEPIAERVEIVRRMFREASNGIGKYSIAARLNEDRVIPWRGSNGWHGSYVHKILTNRAVIGEYQPHRKVERAFDSKLRRRIGGKRIPAGDPIAHYYPEVIDMALWERSRASRADRRGKGGRKGSRIANLLSGLCRCGECQSSMTFRSPGSEHGRDYLICDGALRKMGCSSPTRHPYLPIEEAILSYLDDLLYDPADLNNSEIASAETAVAILADERTTKEREIGRLINALASGDNPYLGEAIRQRTEEIGTIQTKERSAKARLEELHGRVLTSERQAAFDALRSDLGSEKESTRYAARSRIAQQIRSVVTEVIFDPDHPGGILVVVAHGLRLYDIRDGRLLALALEDRITDLAVIANGNIKKEDDIIQVLHRIARIRNVDPAQVGLEHIRRALQTAERNGPNLILRFPTAAWNFMVQHSPILAAKHQSTSRPHDLVHRSPK
jgi:DNA invertase Pin-like site-specific DNA recombinase